MLCVWQFESCLKISNKKKKRFFQLTFVCLNGSVSDIQVVQDEFYPSNYLWSLKKRFLMRGMLIFIITASKQKVSPWTHTLCSHSVAQPILFDGVFAIEITLSLSLWTLFLLLLTVVDLKTPEWCTFFKPSSHLHLILINLSPNHRDLVSDVCLDLKTNPFAIYMLSSCNLSIPHLMFLTQALLKLTTSPRSYPPSSPIPLWIPAL